MLFKDKLRRAKDAFKWGMHILFEDEYPTRKVRGDVFIEMRDATTGKLLHKWEKRNLIVYDASIQAARYFKDKDEPANSLNMLAIGTGATGSLLSPSAPDARQRSLNSEIQRKTFSATTFRDASGNAVSIPTNIVDFTCSFAAAEAVGPLNEMGLMSTLSDNPSTLNPNPDVFPNRDVTDDLTQYDVLVNYLTFPVISKPSTAVLTLTWRLTF